MKIVIHLALYKFYRHISSRYLFSGTFQSRKGVVKKLMYKISALVLVQNSEKELTRCLESLKDLDEVVVVDGGSQDKTSEIAKSYPNVSYYENLWPGFIAQREFSRKKAKNQWCLMLDSDEAITSECLKECKKIINANSPLPLYKIMRTEFFLGKAIESGYGRSSYQERLFERDRIEYFGGVHHKHKIDGTPADDCPEKVGVFPPHFRILHDENYGLDDWLKKFPRFVLLLSEEKKNKKVGALNLLFSFFGNFLKVFGKSYKNGRVGFIIAVQTALFRSMIKLCQYERQKIGFKSSDYKKENLG